MKNLVGKTILVGKEPNTSNLLLSVKVDGKIKSKTLAMNVPQSVSRCFPEKDTAHCKIEVKDADTIILHNTKTPNKTFVDHQEIADKRISRNSRVELGKDHFGLDVDKILTSAIQLVKPIGTPPPPTRPVYSLAHLKPIWENYQKELEDINKQREKIGKVKQTIARCVMIGVPTVVGSLQLVDDNSTTMKLVITLGALLVGVILSFIIPALIKDNSKERLKILNQEMNKNYVCPNPDCLTPFNNTPYDTLSHKLFCGNCRCNYINHIEIEKE